MSYEFIDPRGQKKKFQIWSFTALILDKKPVFVYRALKAGEKADFIGGSVIVFKAEAVYLNGYKENLQPGNYVLKDGVLTKGFIRTFE